ncbi:DNA cytosine methyltransferase [Bradyrhizobium sp. HKCCYLRH1065]|uniref:DNA cytosine methyltransferase n=1 Tax=unclassified Bradyrhizobium TaxID=2631580 RepID=UPI003EBE00E6
MDESKKVIADVRAKIGERLLTEAEASRAIGVTTASLNRHLNGAYVRSDSLVKYRRWLAEGAVEIKPTRGNLTSRDVVSATTTVSIEHERAEPVVGPTIRPGQPLRVVDLFAGCGGLSLGFELAGGGSLFKTVLAIDIEEAMVRVFNANHESLNPGRPIGQRADLSEFLNEAEVLAYYLDHLASSESDGDLRHELDKIAPSGLGDFIRNIQALDDAFIESLMAIRQQKGYLQEYSEIDKGSLSQTSVLAFHQALKLPQPGTGVPSLQATLWGRTSSVVAATDSASVHFADRITKEAASEAKALWEAELEKLRERSAGSGSGQLASAAKKIRNALRLIEGKSYADIRRAWLAWRAARDAARRAMFEDEEVLSQLRRIYRAGREVHILLGGPPCQGFSRIGRGKIRSLREQSVHVQSDTKVGDKRNELMLQYVLFVAALAPAAFLFENVRHFQAEVKTAEGAFNATDVLAEAISDISRDGLSYEVESRVLYASNHLVPQTRERFFMVGIRQDVAETANLKSPAAWCLSLPVRQSVRLKTALAGLPEPVYSSAFSERSGGTDTLLSVEDLHVHGSGEVGEYLEWIRQPPPTSRPEHDHKKVDAHCARDSRPDDREFFEMFGPGKRWMDYRCDGNPLIDELAHLVRWILENDRRTEIAGLQRGRIKSHLEALDGSLSIRLLLDRIQLGPGEKEHHLRAPNYLKKKEGNHGDWLARLDAEAPCKTMTSHMGKDTYAYIHPSAPRTISVREAARVQTFPDWFRFGSVGLVDGYRVIGNAVPPLLSSQLALKLGVVLEAGGVIKRASKEPATRTQALERSSQAQLVLGLRA